MVSCGQSPPGILQPSLTKLHACRTQAMAYLPGFHQDIFINRPAKS